MTCEEATGLLLDRMRGRLPDAARPALGEHLRSCAACREAADAQHEVSALLASRPAADASPSFAARVAARVAEESGWFGMADWRWLSVRLAPVAGLLLLIGGIAIERQSSAASSSASLSIEAWASGGGEDLPVTSVLWQPQANEDPTILLLAAPADATIARQSDER